MRWRLDRSGLLLGLASCVAFAAAFFAVAGRYVSLKWLPPPLVHREGEASTSQPSYRQVNGEQLVMIYFGSAHCAWANDKAAPALLGVIRSALERQAKRQGWSFEAIGVALDWVPEEGLDHLRSIGRFDEVSAGYNWANMLAIKFFGDELRDPASTPEIMVMRRSLRRPEPLAGTANFRVVREQLLARKAGLFELRRWALDGAPLSDSVSAPGNIL